jgi:uncharacterized membrane protein YedE/YeeE
MTKRVTAVLSFLFFMPGLFIILLLCIALFLPSFDTVLVAGAVLFPLCFLLGWSNAKQPAETKEKVR